MGKVLRIWRTSLKSYFVNPNKTVFNCVQCRRRVGAMTNVLPSIFRPKVAHVVFLHMKVVKIRPGTFSGWPYTNFAEEHLRSSLGDVRTQWRTSGNSLHQLMVLHLDKRDAFSSQWNLSIMPLTLGLYSLVRILWVSKSFTSSANNLLSNCFPSHS